MQPAVDRVVTADVRRAIPFHEDRFVYFVKRIGRDMNVDLAVTRLGHLRVTGLHAGVAPVGQERKWEAECVR